MSGRERELLEELSKVDIWGDSGDRAVVTFCSCIFIFLYPILGYKNWLYYQPQTHLHLQENTPLADSKTCCFRSFLAPLLFPKDVAVEGNSSGSEIGRIQNRGGKCGYCEKKDMEM